MNPAIPIVVASVLLQGASAVLAVRLIFRLRAPGPGVVVILLTGLMTFRRVLSLYRILSGGEVRADLPAEAVGLSVSVLFLAVVLQLTRRILSEMELSRQKEALIAELRDALASVKTLKGLLPICAACKKIRDDRGYWERIEDYLRDHSEAEFTHGLCPKCLEEGLKELREGSGGAP